MDHSWYQQQHKQFCVEVQNPDLSGPNISHQSEPHLIAERLSHTGYHFGLTTSFLAMSAPILKVESWSSWPLENLYLHPEYVPFSFSDFPYGVPKLGDTPLLRITNILSELYSNTDNARNLLKVLSLFEPFLSQSRQTALHSQCQNFVSSRLRKLGFSIAKIDPQNENIRIRLVWLFPSYRASGRNHYLRVGTIRLQQAQGNIYDSAEFIPSSSDAISSVLRNHLLKEVGGDLLDVFSKEGKERIMDKFLWSNGIRSPQKKTRQRRLEFVETHKDLWTNHRLLAKALQKYGLYSSKTNLSDVESSCQSLIKEIQEKVNRN